MLFNKAVEIIYIYIYKEEKEPMCMKEERLTVVISEWWDLED